MDARCGVSRPRSAQHFNLQIPAQAASPSRPDAHGTAGVYSGALAAIEPLGDARVLTALGRAGEGIRISAEPRLNHRDLAVGSYEGKFCAVSYVSHTNVTSPTQVRMHSQPGFAFNLADPSLSQSINQARLQAALAGVNPQQMVAQPARATPRR